MRDQIAEKVEALITPLIEELSAELVDLQIKHRQNAVVIDVIAEKSGGITIGECVRINKMIDRAIEERQWFGEDYIVEVASPGLDRELKTPKDFKRVLGRMVRFHLLAPVEEKVEHVGAVTEVKEDQIMIKKNDKIIVIPIEVISKAVQVIE